jgi:beta-galactosidase
MKTCIRNHHGAPTLFIDGQPDTGLMLYHNNVERGHDEIADFARAGIDLITTSVGSTASMSTDAIDEKMRLILKANPRALVLTRLGIGPSAEWATAHPGEMNVNYDPYLDQNVESEYRIVSFASAPWRAEMGAQLQELIRYCEENYSDHFLGYHLAAGECGEWAYAWRHYTQSDYSPAQLAAFRRWRNDPAAEIPRDWRRHEGDDGVIHDPVLQDYMRFHSEVVADAVCHFARLAKEELARLGREKIVAIFYGYHFTPPGNPSAFFNSGHHALAKVLASPDVDVLCAPYSYFQREAGGTYYSQLVAGSVRLAGKLYYSEEDTVTHVVPAVPYRYHCPDRWTTENVLRRNILGSLRDGGTSWYMDWFGSNWYRDDALMADIAATQQLAQQRLAFDNQSVAQIAVVVDESIVTRLQHDPELINRWTLERLNNLWRLGAPVDVFLKPDRPKIDREQYRLIVELDREQPTNWREQAHAAGVHLYTDAGDQILAERQLLTIHASSDGPRRIRLPRPCRIVEAFTGETVLEHGTEFTITLRRGETAVWTLREAEGPV